MRACGSNAVEHPGSFMTKPLLFPANLLIGFEGRMIEAIDNRWRKHSVVVVPTLSEAIRRLVATVPVGLVLFLAAGTVVWPVAWFFLAQLFVLFFVGGLWLARHDPALLEARLAPPIQRGQPAADKMLLTLLILLNFAALAVMALDAVRFAQSSVPPWVQAVGELILLLSVWIVIRTLRENSFAAPVVKIQEDRGQTVVATGPYRHVRHPMYAATLVALVGTSLLLGSWWGLLVVFARVVLISIRIRIEERTLRAGLHGYDEYAARVPYRLIPLVW
jgi:protein-S-isoprenylcysteine O-methyltransferase Ste14